MSCNTCNSIHPFCKCNCGKYICALCIINDYMSSHQFSCESCNVLYDLSSIFRDFPSFFSLATDKMIFFINNHFSSLTNYRKMRSPFKTATEKYKDDKLSSYIKKKNELQQLVSSVNNLNGPSHLSHAVRDSHLNEIRYLNNVIDHLFASKRHTFQCPRCTSELYLEDNKFTCRCCNTIFCSKCYCYLDAEHMCSKALVPIFNQNRPEIYSSYHFNYHDENKHFITLFKVINELVNNPYFNSSLINIVHGNYSLPSKTVVSKKYTFTFDMSDDFLLSAESIRAPVKMYIYMSIIKNTLKIFMNKLHSRLLRDHFDKDFHLNYVLELNEKLERVSRSCEMHPFIIEL
jgi:hypothetical protein